MLMKYAEYGMEIGRMYDAELSSVLANKVKGTPDERWLISIMRLLKGEMKIGEIIEDSKSAM